MKREKKWKFRANFHTEWFINSQMKKEIREKGSREYVEWKTAAILRSAVERFGIVNDFIRFTRVGTHTHTHAINQRKWDEKAPKIEHAKRFECRKKRKNARKIYCVWLVIPAIILSPNIYGLTQSLSKTRQTELEVKPKPREVTLFARRDDSPRTSSRTSWPCRVSHTSWHPIVHC